jgi:hypothetical protein
MNPEPSHLRRQREKAAEIGLLRKEEVRRALDPETGEPIPLSWETRAREGKQFLQGKMTFIGLALTAAGAIGRLFGWELPADEVNSFLTWLLASWDGLAQGVGILLTAWGRARINWRK